MAKQPPRTRSRGAQSVPQNQPQLQPSGLDFPVVGIGASAGGLQAIIRFLEHLPAKSNMAFVVVMHLSPRHESNAAKIMQGHTSMPVQQVTKAVPIEKNRVYVISPAQQLLMNDGHLRVREPEPSRGGHVAIDLFFRDLADVHKERAFCVVLSGTGSDGAVGLSRIKEQGGVTLAQAPDDAEYDDMPRSAIATGNVDLVLPVVEMPQRLIELWQNARSIHLPHAEETDLASASTPEGQVQDAENALREILHLLFNRTGHNFRHYKRAKVLRRIERRMQVTAQPDLNTYLSYLQEHREEAKALLGDMLIGVTNFFRDREAFEALERDVIPNLFGEPDGLRDDEGEIRVWSAGCSSGEEAYSLAMLLVDQARLADHPPKLQVFATDIDERAIATGRHGIYPESILTDVPPSRLREYFVKQQQSYQVKKEIRERVLFAQHSLLRDPPFSRLQLIVCRNLLIYLNRDVQRQILQMFHFALRPGGYLFLGNSESADLCQDLFAPVDKKNRVFRAKAGLVAHRPMSTMSTVVGQKQSAPAQQRFSEPRRQSLAEVHQRVLEQYAPPSVIVNPESDIVHMSDRAGHFLRYVGGEPSHNLLTLVRPELRLELRTALFQAIQSNKSVEARRVKVKREGKRYYINMIARPFKEEETNSEFVLVLFDEVEDTMGDETEESHEGAKDSVLSQLEEELQRTKLQLQDTLEQSRVSTEELKASNEELQAINEELRSATEELETSKEELQSINEELITVNHELKIKVEETDKINDDLQNLITSTDIATVFVDRSLRIKWFTPRATDIFSMLPVDSGRSLMDITHRLDYAEMADDADHVFESLTTVEREVRSSDDRYYLARLLPYRTSEDYIEGAVLTFIDVTARRAAEAELRLGEERMRVVAESTEDHAIIVLDPEGLITSWNRGAELIFGYDRNEVIGQNCDLIFVPEDRANGVPEDELRRARENGRADDERWHLRKDGSRFYCSGVVNVLDSDSFKGYVKIARDLTERQRILDAQQMQLDETRSASQLKDEFFAVMSHELKHPLNLIQLNAELMSRLPATRAVPVAAKAVRTIQEAVSGQARIIDDLLDVSRVRTGKLKLQRSAVDLGRLLQDIHRVVSKDGETRTISLQIDKPADGVLLVHADPVRVEQIIWNLLHNALKFTAEDGQIELRASLEDQQARVVVADNGLGIAADFLDKVFDLFGQADTQHVRLHREGLGIGLSLVRQLAEAQGGSVAVNSAGLDKGSTFTVWLPLYQERPLPDDQPQPNDGERLRGVQVLLVDDSVEVLEVMNMLLQAEGATVHAFSEPAQALEQASSLPVELIISDIGMPHMSGHELIKALRKIPALTSVPALAMTGYGSQDDVRKALAAGFDQHVGKPVSYEGLIDAIKQLELDRKR
ncbi:MAG: CheR family methyltransferase [Halopseudomonas sp.]|uniref:CheR family methyltransferase n=1 Tax=Halopseudomonas sp. TaxID=2901191 RepID=UPI0030036D81